MSIFSNPFRSTPNTNQWPIIAASISSGFQDVKRRWFNECVVAMDLGLFADKEEKAKVVHTDLGGAGALAVTGYQICCASSIIARNGYISKTSTKDFLDLLWGRVSGVETRELLKYTRRYDGVSSDTPTQQFRLGVDVARYVINGEPSMIISLQVASLAQKLSAQTCMVIANAFGDSAGVRKLSRQITLPGKYPVLCGR
jgi:hypothetical protein